MKEPLSRAHENDLLNMATAVNESEAVPSEKLDFLLNMRLPLSISFGRAWLPLREVLRLQAGSVVELDRGGNGSVELVVNGSVIATGELVVVEGEYGVRILEMVGQAKRLQVSTLPSPAAPQAKMEPAFRKSDLRGCP
jgi:flagellar motor switch protein FliN/FliY